MFQVPNQFRVTPELCDRNRTSQHLQNFISKDTDGNVGAFVLPAEGKKAGSHLFAIASDAHGWEHVMVAVMRDNRYPTWPEMNYVRKLFWGEQDCVLQYHVPAAEKGNNLPHYLHLWRSPAEGSVIWPTPHLVDIQSMLKQKG